MPVELRYRDAHGTPGAGVFEYGAEFGVIGGLRMRRMRAPDGVEYTQRYLSADEVTTGPLTRLENEIRATARLWQVFGGATYPAHLPRLIGFDLGSDEPYVLFDGYSGRPLADLRGRLGVAEAQRVWSGLVSALVHTTTAGIVHGDVGLPSVWWDGATAQLVFFDNAWTTLDGTPAAESDLGAVRKVLTQTTDRALLPRQLRRAVHGTVRRPAVSRLARKTRVVVTPRPPDTALEAGRRRFDALAAEKNGRPGSRPRRTRKIVVVLALVLVPVVIAGLVIAGLS
ncbi:hypothetical protein KOI35_26310 [Actinoplanes bogorensis]|uniref:Protein kinase domain-containing protein n=1 Tax=Paractinoplanes bogorensis TaxID=1610840 RepID=A0ABS5YU92_9ACTN|nr:hypothetical protein [Actinoplanes bogorensis]MBU2667031.1 hypothetical protein [Actinoplanes bogorensis]